MANFSNDVWMASTASGFYPHTIDQSLRFEDGDSAKLTRTPSSASNRATWTWSGWVKRGNLGTNQQLFCSTAGDYNLRIHTDNTIIFEGAFGTNTSAAVFRDVSAFYHIVAVHDTTEGTASNRFKLYVNGVQQTTSGAYPSGDGLINNTVEHGIGGQASANFFDGYMSEVNFIDGTALGPDSFGETKDGIWVPKNVSGLTYGTNGFHLDFADSSAIGNDVSGQNNDYTVSGGGSPTLVASDVTDDAPTNNHSTWNPLVSKLNIALSEGNTVVNLDDNATGEADMVSTMVCPLGVDIYGEFKATAFHGGAADSGINIGIIEQGFNRTEQTNTIRQISGGVFYAGNGYLYTDSVASGSAQATYTLNDIIGIKVDRTADEVKFYKNNVLQWTEDIDATKQYHFGVDSGYTNSTRAISYQGYFAASSWTYTPETNFLALCSASLPEPKIIDASEYFNTVIYTGDNSQDVTGVGFRPDLVWVKTRDHTYNHQLHDSVRGATAGALFSNTTTAETSFQFDSFDADGFTTDASNITGINATGDSQVAWNWLAGTSVSGATTGSGTAKTYTGSVNTEAGFSIIKYVGNGTSGHTIPHHLGKAPTFIIVKELDNASNWRVWGTGVSIAKALGLNTTNAEENSGNDNGNWNNTLPTDTVFSVGSFNSGNRNNADLIAYCFTDIDQYCKAGSYIGNSNADGTYVHLNFRPAWVMIKEAGASGFWMITDNKVYPNTDGNTRSLAANDTGTETTISNRGNEVDFLSNGFKIRASTGDMGASNTHIYLAFAEQPFKYANAR